MSGFIWVSESFSVQVASTLLHFLWQGLLIAAIVTIAGWGLKNSSARVRYAVNVTALLLMVACLPLTFALIGAVKVSETSVTSTGAGLSISGGKTATQTGRSESALAGSDTDLRAVVTEGAARNQLSVEADPTFRRETEQELVEKLGELPAADALDSQLQTWSGSAATIVTGSYFAGVLLMMMRLLLGLRGGQDLRRISTAIEDAEFLAMVRAQVEKLGLRSVPPVSFCDRISIPVVIGVFRPVILLPACLVSGLTSDQLWALVTHELAHIRRYDLHVNLLQRAIEAVLFFHPAVWIVSRRVSSERENATDDEVVAAGCPATRYADALVRMAELSLSIRGANTVAQLTSLAATGGSSSEFKRRVLRLIDMSVTPQIRLTRGGVLTILLATSSLMVVPFLVQSRAAAIANEKTPPVTEASTPAAGDADDSRETATATETETETDADSSQERKSQPKSAQGATTIDGFVRGSEGALANVKVTVTLSLPPEKPTPVTNGPSGETVRELVYRTGKDGRYQITIPAALRSTSDLMISFRFSHPDYLERVVGAVPVSDFDSSPVSRRERGIHRSMVPRAIAQTRLRRAHRLEGRVLLPDGSPAAGAVVQTATKYRPYSWKFFSPDDYSFSASATTDKEGQFSLVTDDRSTLAVLMAGQAPLLIDDLQRPGGAAGQKQIQEFRIPAGIRLSGRVLDDRGQPVPRAIVSVRREFAWNEADMPQSFSVTCAADEHGEYTLPPLPEDRYRLSVDSQLNEESSVDEYNAWSMNFNRGSKPVMQIEPLNFVFVPVIHALEWTTPRPQRDLSASPMVSIQVTVLFPDGSPDPDRYSDIGISGLIDGRDWHGQYARADANGMAVLHAPKGLRLASIKTGLARHRLTADSPIEIGEAIHLGELDGDRDGFVVMKPQLARLKVKLNLPDELSRELSRGQSHLSITASHVRKGFRENSPTRQRIALPGSVQTGTTAYEGTALPNEPVQLRVTVQKGDIRKTVYEEELTLAAGEERLKEITLDSKAARKGDPRVDAAIRKAVDYLLKQQNQDGTWRLGKETRFLTGSTALTGLALSDAGAAAEAGIAAAAKSQQDSSSDFTKEVALQTLFLHRTGKPGTAAVRRNIQWLVKSQIKAGPDAGSWSYRQDPTGMRGDGANVAYALLALATVAPAGQDKTEFAVPDEVWERAQAWLMSSQNQDGGWGYVRGETVSTGAMTACALAGLKSLTKRIGKSAVREAAIRRGRAWLAARWTPDRNPGSSSWNLFYLRWLCRALSDTELPGQESWKRQVKEMLLKQQRDNGSFRSKTPAMSSAVSTAFALEILKQCRQTAPAEEK